MRPWIDLLFFFSSRRRHTRLQGDWSSDVCSSDLRHHKMSVELSVATTGFLGDTYTFIDCPGSVEFIHDMRAALPAVDAAVEIGRAACRERVEISVVGGSLKKKKETRSSGMCRKSS